MATSGSGRRPKNRPAVAATLVGVSAHENPGPVAAGYAERISALEEENLSPLAARSWPADRSVPEEDCTVRTPFQRDRDRIVHSKAFRRLKHKTQVFVSPEGDHYRTRLTHTIEVTQIARTVARALRLNEDLTEAIGLGHDLGHPPFGHIGEAVLDDCLQERFGSGFRHYEQSLRVVEVLERDGQGLNLTADVKDGIACHSGRAPMPRTLEGMIVRIVDRVAYLNHDIDDALRAGVIAESDLPAVPIAALGQTGSQRIDALVHDMIENSEIAGAIVQGEESAAAMDELRSWMFENVYLGPQARTEHDRIDRVIRTLFNHYTAAPETIPDFGARPGEDAGVRVTDYISGMTDRYCVRVFEELTVPESFAT